VELEDGISLPVSSLNAMRREAVSQLLERKTKGPGKRRLQYDFNENTEKKKASEADQILEFYFYSKDSIDIPEIIKYIRMFRDAGIEFDDYRILIPVTEFIQMKKELQLPEWLHLVPYIPNISKGVVDLYLETHVDMIAEDCMKTGIYIGNLGWIQEFQDKGVEVFGDYGLNINNLEAEKWAKAIGLACHVPSLENYKGTQDTNWLYAGDVPLMVTEYRMELELKERKSGLRLKATYLNNIGKTVLFEKQGEAEYGRLLEYFKHEKHSLRIFMG
jgi:putative protease